MARSVTVTTLVAAVRSLADIENDDHISDTLIKEWLSSFWAELYETIVSSGLAYYECIKSYPSNGNSRGLYALPSDFYAPLRVDYVASADNYTPLKEINLRELHRVARTTTGQASFYRVVGSNLVLYPAPPSGQTYEMKYIPAPADLTSSSVTEVDGVAGWEEYPIRGAVINALSKQDRDTAVHERRLAALKKRIEGAALNRGIANATTLYDERGGNDWFNYDFAFDPANWRRGG